MNYTKRSDGRYQSKVYIGCENGKKKYKFFYGRTIKELEEKIRVAKTKQSKGIDIMSLDDTLSKWIERYLEVRQHNINQKEYDTEKHRLQLFDDELGQYKIKDISQQHIQGIIYKLAEKNPTTRKPTSKKTLRYYLLALSLVFNFAIGNRVTDYNPCKYVTIPESAPKSKRRALQPHEIQRVIEFEHFMQLPAMIMMFAGLRRGEVGALTWSDIDLINHTILINKAFDLNTMQLKPPKTDAGTRLITIPQNLVNYLASQERTALYVVHINRLPLTSHQWQYQWDKYIEALNDKYGTPSISSVKMLTIQPFTPHCLRHTYATMLHANGVDVVTAKTLLGHADIQTTINIYTHLDSLKKKLSIGNFDTAFSWGCQMGVSNIENQ